MGDAIRGISSREYIVWLMFRDLARGDFKHDFGERVPARDLFTAADVNRFFEIAKNVSKKGKVFLTQKFLNDAVDKTVFQLLGGTFDRFIPNAPAPPAPVAAPGQGFLTEEELFTRVTGMDFNGVKRLEAPSQLNFRLPNGTARSYTIRSSSYRQGLRGSPQYNLNRNIATMFQEVTGKNKFALIIDASGGLPLTEILNTTLGPAPTAATEFFIIENIENASDSATKLTNIRASPPGGAVPIPTLRFLKDSANTIVYPIWENNADPKSNIYSSLKIVLNRVANDETEADIEVTNGAAKTIIHIGDVSNSSNVKNASLRAYAEFLEKGLGAPDPYVYTLIKRMGDWCQALSLLDLDRQYNILDTSRGLVPVPNTTTLRSMLVDTEVGIVTNDRILLSYCLLHGINVFYTTAMDVAKMIYFKNNNDVPAGPVLQEQITAMYEPYRTSPDAMRLITPHIASIQTALQAYERLIVAQSQVHLYIQQIRNYFTNVGNLRTEFDTLNAQYITNKRILDVAGGDAAVLVNKFNAVNALISIATKITLDIAHNDSILQNLNAGIYSGMQTDGIRLESLRRKLATGGRITKSVEIVEAKNILLGVRDDIKQVVAKGIVPIERIRSLLKDRFAAPDERAQTNYDEIMSVVPVLKLILPPPAAGGGQKGGAIEQLPNVFRALRTRSIRIIPAGVEEQTSTVNFYKIGDVYYDEKMKPYTVSDEYIITEDDLSTFRLLFNGLVAPVPPTDEVKYVFLKYLLLRLDILSQEFENLQYEYQEDVSVFEPGTIQYNKLGDIRNTALLLGTLTGERLLPTTMYLYLNTIPPAAAPVVGETIIQSIGPAISAARTFLIQGIPPRLDPTEQVQNSFLQSMAANAAARSGYLRELIAQRFGQDLRLIVRNVYNQAEGERLGSILEYNLLTPSIIPETRSDIDYTAELVGQALLQWSNGGVPEAKLNDIKLYTKQQLEQQRRRIPAGGLRPRRPLYSNDQGTHALRSLHDNDSGLRKRRRTRRTRRLRKSTRKSKTR
jgi:hypothetical protein